MIHRSARQRLSRLYWAFRNQVCRRTWSFFVWESQSQLPQLTQGRIILAGKGDEAIGERMAVLRGDSVDQYRAWLRDGHWVLYAVGPDNDIQSWIWFTVAEGGSQIAPFDFGIGMKVPPGTGFLWNAFTVPAYRRRGLYKTLLMQSVEECFVHGARRVWGHAQVTNTSRTVILTTDPQVKPRYGQLVSDRSAGYPGPAFIARYQCAACWRWTHSFLSIGTKAAQPAS